MRKKYGLLFSLYVCEHNIASVASFAKKFNVPIKDIRKVANRLKKDGVLASKRGRYGGYSLIGRPTVLSAVGSV